MKNFSRIIFFFFLVNVSTLSAQDFLRISFNRFGNTRMYDVFKYELFEFKLKGQVFYTVKKIIHMQDSMMVFEDNSVIKLSQLKAIRLRKHNHLVSTFQAAFLIAGIGFFSLNTVNNLIMNTQPVVDERAAVISLGLLTTSFLVRELNIKRIRINKNKNLKIVIIDYQKLNLK